MIIVGDRSGPAGDTGPEDVPEGVQMDVDNLKADLVQVMDWLKRKARKKRSTHDGRIFHNRVSDLDEKTEQGLALLSSMQQSNLAIHIRPSIVGLGHVVSGIVPMLRKRRRFSLQGLRDKMSSTFVPPAWLGDLEEGVDGMLMWMNSAHASANRVPLAKGQRRMSLEPHNRFPQNRRMSTPTSPGEFSRVPVPVDSSGSVASAGSGGPRSRTSAPATLTHEKSEGRSSDGSAGGGGRGGDEGRSSGDYGSDRRPGKEAVTGTDLPSPGADWTTYTPPARRKDQMAHSAEPTGSRTAPPLPRRGSSQRKARSGLERYSSYDDLMQDKGGLQRIWSDAEMFADPVAEDDEGEDGEELTHIMSTDGGLQRMWSDGRDGESQPEEDGEGGGGIQRLWSHDDLVPEVVDDGEGDDGFERGAADSGLQRIWSSDELVREVIAPEDEDGSSGLQRMWTMEQPGIETFDEEDDELGDLTPSGGLLRLWSSDEMLEEDPEVEAMEEELAPNNGLLRLWSTDEFSAPAGARAAPGHSGGSIGQLSEFEEGPEEAMEKELSQSGGLQRLWSSDELGEQLGPVGVGGGGGAGGGGRDDLGDVDLGDDLAGNGSQVLQRLWSSDAIGGGDLGAVSDAQDHRHNPRRSDDSEEGVQVGTSGLERLWSSDDMFAPNGGEQEPAGPPGPREGGGGGGSGSTLERLWSSHDLHLEAVNESDSERESDAESFRTAQEQSARSSGSILTDSGRNMLEQLNRERLSEGVGGGSTRASRGGMSRSSSLGDPDTEGSPLRGLRGGTFHDTEPANVRNAQSFHDVRAPGLRRGRGTPNNNPRASRMSPEHQGPLSTHTTQSFNIPLATPGGPVPTLRIATRPTASPPPYWSQPGGAPTLGPAASAAVAAQNDPQAGGTVEDTPMAGFFEGTFGRPVPGGRPSASSRSSNGSSARVSGGTDEMWQGATAPSFRSSRNSDPVTMEASPQNSVPSNVGAAAQLRSWESEGGHTQRMRSVRSRSMELRRPAEVLEGISSPLHGLRGGTFHSPGQAEVFAHQVSASFNDVRHAPSGGWQNRVMGRAASSISRHSVADLLDQARGRTPAPDSTPAHLHVPLHVPEDVDVGGSPRVGLRGGTFHDDEAPLHAAAAAAAAAAGGAAFGVHRSQSLTAIRPPPARHAGGATPADDPIRRSQSLVSLVGAVPDGATVEEAEAAVEAVGSQLRGLRGGTFHADSDDSLLVSSSFEDPGAAARARQNARASVLSRSGTRSLGTAELSLRLRDGETRGVGVNPMSTIPPAGRPGEALRGGSSRSLLAGHSSRSLNLLLSAARGVEPKPAEEPPTPRLPGGSPASAGGAGMSVASPNRPLPPVLTGDGAAEAGEDGDRLGEMLQFPGSPGGSLRGGMNFAEGGSGARAREQAEAGGASSSGTSPPLPRASPPDRPVPGPRPVLGRAMSMQPRIEQAIERELTSMEAHGSALNRLRGGTFHLPGEAQAQLVRNSFHGSFHDPNPRRGGGGGGGAAFARRSSFHVAAGNRGQGGGGSFNVPFPAVDGGGVGRARRNSYEVPGSAAMPPGPAQGRRHSYQDNKPSTSNAPSPSTSPAGARGGGASPHEAPQVPSRLARTLSARRVDSDAPQPGPYSSLAASTAPSGGFQRRSLDRRSLDIPRGAMVPRTALRSSSVLAAVPMRQGSGLRSILGRNSSLSLAVANASAAGGDDGEPATIDTVGSPLHGLRGGTFHGPGEAEIQVAVRQAQSFHDGNYGARRRGTHLRGGRSRGSMDARVGGQNCSSVSFSDPRMGRGWSSSTMPGGGGRLRRSSMETARPPGRLGGGATLPMRSGGRPPAAGGPRRGVHGGRSFMDEEDFVEGEEDDFAIGYTSMPASAFSGGMRRQSLQMPVPEEVTIDTVGSPLHGLRGGTFHGPGEAEIEMAERHAQSFHVETQQRGRGGGMAGGWSVGSFHQPAPQFRSSSMLHMRGGAVQQPADLGRPGVYSASFNEPNHNMTARSRLGMRMSSARNMAEHMEGEGEAVIASIGSPLTGLRGGTFHDD